jgi:NAD(P)-dependent dehydrogenase (short-subunit alcohol dehydrogenase family)
MSNADKPVAIIVGGGRGMGAAIAQELYQRGYHLSLMSPSGSAEALAATLGGIGVTGKAENAADLDHLVAQTTQRWGRVDAVVTLAGHPPKADLLAIPDEDWVRGNDMMMMPVIRMARHVTPIMETQGKGAFVNITTFAALEPTLAFPVSCAYRAALASFT